MRLSFCVEPMTPVLWFQPESMPAWTLCTSPVRVFTQGRVRSHPGGGASDTCWMRYHCPAA